MFQDRVPDDLILSLVEAHTTIEQVGTDGGNRVFHTTSLVGYFFGTTKEIFILELMFYFVKRQMWEFFQGGPHMHR
jgi:hypothetical protein